MNERIEELMYQAGLTAQGCWDEMDEYDRKAIERFADLILMECIRMASLTLNYNKKTDKLVKDYFELLNEKR